MTHAHDFVGPFLGASCQCAINLAVIEKITQQPHDLGVTFFTNSPDRWHTLKFDTPENYNLAISILRNQGVLLSTVKIEP